MISRYIHHGLTWIDLESPTREELLHTCEEFSLPKPVEEELFSKKNGSKIELYEQFIFLTLHFPQQLNFIVGKKHMITIRYEAIEAAQDFAALFENAELLDYHKKISDSGIMFMELMKKLYDHSSQELLEITARIPAIENNMFAKKENSMVKVISQTSIKIMSFKEVMQPHLDVLNAYKVASKQLFGDAYSYYASLILADFNKIYNEVTAKHDTLKELRHTNAALLSIRTNTLLKNVITTIVLATIVIIISLFLWH